MRKIQLKLWQKSETQIVTKLKKIKLQQNSKTLKVTKPKISNCDKSQIATKVKNWNSNKLKKGNSNKLKNSSCYKTKKNLIVPNSKIQIVTKLINSNSDNSKTLVLTILNFETKINLLVRTTWHLDNCWDLLWPAFCDLPMFFLFCWW